MERCLTCQYYDRHHGKVNDGRSLHSGQCRRGAPQLHPLNAKSYMIEGIWPTVRDDDWCGEWKALVRRVDPNRINEALSGNGTGPRAAVSDVPPRATVISSTPVQPPSRPVSLLMPATPPAGNPPSKSGSPFSFGPVRGD